MSELCETVRIVGDAPGGYVVINKEDFDPTSQVLFVEPQDEQPMLYMAPPEDEAAIRAEHAAGVDATLDQLNSRAVSASFESVDEALDVVATKRKPRKVSRPTGETA